eukprot:scaffold4090_cov302-Prasinococcus_capsulatus_cf.AAC.2
MSWPRGPCRAGCGGSGPDASVFVAGRFRGRVPATRRGPGRGDELPHAAPLRRGGGAPPRSGRAPEGPQRVRAAGGSAQGVSPGRGGQRLRTPTSVGRDAASLARRSGAAVSAAPARHNGPARSYASVPEPKTHRPELPRTRSQSVRSRSDQSPPATRHHTQTCWRAAPRARRPPGCSWWPRSRSPPATTTAIATASYCGSPPPTTPSKRCHCPGAAAGAGAGAGAGAAATAGGARRQHGTRAAAHRLPSHGAGGAVATATAQRAGAAPSLPRDGARARARAGARAGASAAAGAAAGAASAAAAGRGGGARWGRHGARARPRWVSWLAQTVVMRPRRELMLLLRCRARGRGQRGGALRPHAGGGGALPGAAALPGGRARAHARADGHARAHACAARHARAHRPGTQG